MTSHILFFCVTIIRLSHLKPRIGPPEPLAPPTGSEPMGVGTHIASLAVPCRPPWVHGGGTIYLSWPEKASGSPPEELDSVAGQRGVWVSLLKLFPPNLTPSKKSLVGIHINFKSSFFNEFLVVYVAAPAFAV